VLRTPSASADETRERIISTAERLFADHGIEAVSLRQIAAEAGQRNTGAVRYHFGDRDGLVRAIFESRLPRINESRRRLLADVSYEEEGSEDAYALVAAYALPLVEQMQSGRYVGFLNRLNYYARQSHPMRQLEPLQTSTADEVLSRLAEKVPHPSRRFRGDRVGLVAEFVISALDNLQMRRNTSKGDNSRSSLEEVVAELLNLATVMIEAPARPPSNRMRLLNSPRDRATAE
jgi:AcrR family transcriptional regulator